MTRRRLGSRTSFLSAAPLGGGGGAMARSRRVLDRGTVLAALLGLAVTDTFTHAWDLAKATGQDTDRFQLGTLGALFFQAFIIGNIAGHGVN